MVIRERQAKKSYLPEWALKQILSQCCAGLVPLHKEDLCVRDITSERIFVDATGTVKLADYGVSELLRYAGEGQPE